MASAEGFSDPSYAFAGEAGDFSRTYQVYNSGEKTAQAGEAFESASQVSRAGETAEEVGNVAGKVGETEELSKAGEVSKASELEDVAKAPEASEFETPKEEIKPEQAENMANDAPEKNVPDEVIRQDNDFGSKVNYKGHPKAYIDEEGNLVPANPEGNGSIVSHIRGGNSGESPYISTSDIGLEGEPKYYGDDRISIDTKRLQSDIESGKVRDVEIITHDEVVDYLEERVSKAENKYESNPSDKNLRGLEKSKADLEHARRDNEVLIKGVIPKDYINR